MSGAIPSIGLPEIIAGIMLVALNAYVLMGGADYGGGVWDLLASGPRTAEQRALIAESIGPVWEADHVWLIVVVVMLFTAFSPAFSMLGIVLHVPLTLLVLGIVLRGSAFVFRAYGAGAGAGRASRRWGVIFAVASTVTPVLIGTAVGAIASDRVGIAASRIGQGSSFAEVFIFPWLSPFPIAVGVFALALFSFLAAVYLALAARDPALRDDFRRRGLDAAVAVFVLAAVALALAPSGAPRVAHGIAGTRWALLLHLCTAIAAITAIVALVVRRYRLARLAAAAQVSLILWGWAWAQFPYLVPPTLTIRGAASPPITLRLLLIGLAIGAAVLIPSLRYLIRNFANAAE